MQDRETDDARLFVARHPLRPTNERPLFVAIQAIVRLVRRALHHDVWTAAVVRRVFQGVFDLHDVVSLCCVVDHEAIMAHLDTRINTFAELF